MRPALSPLFRTGPLYVVCFLFLLVLPSCTSSPDLNDPAVREALIQAQNLGLAYLEENQLDEAEAAFLEVIARNPKDAGGLANLGVINLRRGAFDKAVTFLQDAQRLDPSDPSIPLSLAEAHQQLEQIQRARSVIAQALDRTPDHIPTLYKRAQLYADDPAEMPEYVRALEAVLEKASANVVPRFYYIEGLIQTGQLEDALTQLMTLQQQVPDLPIEAQPHFAEAVAALESDNQDDALRSARIFHNLMKVTPLYQTSLRLMGIRTDALVGVPVISAPAPLSQSAMLDTNRSPDILEKLAFTDASANARLQDVLPTGMVLSAFALADFNGDGEVDVAMAGWHATSNAASLHLLNNQFGRFVESAAPAEFPGGTSQTRFMLAGDFDNDTLIDLYLVNEGPNQLFRNDGEGNFEEVSATAGVDDATPGNKAVFADLDHDGDLDLFVARNTTDLIYRNNLDGTFTEIGASMGLSGEATATTDVDFGDFDDDGDLDLVVAGEQGVLLYNNARQGRFEPPQVLIAPGETMSVAVAAGDYNNDGFLDLYVNTGTGSSLLVNQGTDQSGIRFESVEGLPSSITNISATDARFLDFDNDGYLDLALAGLQTRLLHNDRDNTFSDVSSQLLPESILSDHLTFTDYNLDRDLDLFIGSSEGIKLLRNDGGQLNRSISIQTRGLLSNNSKNNYFSIGAKIEVRAGDLYQMRVVTEPTTYFGLGQRLKADVIRIVFTNGVPQNIFSPGTDQDIIEQQILKGSCPFLYTWNGEAYTFATDLLWRSALGMPLGIMGGQTTYAPASSAEDYIKVPDGLLVEDDEQYRLRITDELWETPFFDEVKLLTIDHPDALDIFIDERFAQPQPEPLPIYTLASTQPPVSAVDETGTDLLDKLLLSDGYFAGPIETTRYQGLMAQHDLILDPGVIDPNQTILYLKGWIFPTDASINIAMSQSDAFAPLPPQVQVMDANGNWVTVIENMGFPMGKNKVVRVDLRGKFKSADHRVRIRTNMQLYWDEAFFATETESGLMHRTRLSPVTATLRYRGFSKMYRNSPFGPHLFDYAEVSTEPRWRDLEGRYTRYGDVQPLLSDSDNQYVIMNAGDEMQLTFDATHAPALPAGWKRSFILYSNGWLKDGDLNTAHGKTVEPLPFIGMSRYPYGPNESYPMTDANRHYLDTYNTRIVTQQAFRALLKPGTE